MATPIQVTVDCTDPDRLATFWATALGYKKQDPPTGYATWATFLAAQGVPEDQWNAASALVDPAGIGPRIYFQQVPEPKTVKNRVHLDVNVGGGRDTPDDERYLVREERRIPHDCISANVDAGADHKGSEELPDRYDKTLRRGLCDHVPSRKAELGNERRQMVRQPALFDHDAFRRAG